MAGEVWKPVVGYEGLYEVSDLGRVRSLDRGVQALSRWGSAITRQHRGRVLATFRERHGYELISLVSGGKGAHRRTRVHRIVAEAFIGLCPTGLEVDHINGVKRDNRAANLRYVTRSENLRSCERLGLMKNRVRGEGYKSAKLNNELVREIRHMLVASTCSQRRIAKAVGVSHTTIKQLANGAIWKHVT